MSESDIIKEFLVSLGFQLDQAGERKFTDAITRGTRDALKFGGAVAGTAVALAAFTEKMAASVESLYFMSQRTGAAIANIQGYRYAATQLGASVEDATASLENMGNFLRYNPGAENYLNSLKVQTRDANGELIDTTKIMANLGKQLAAMPPYLQKAYGDFFHLSDKQLRAITSGEYQQGLDDHNARLREAGVEMQALGVETHDYETAWRRLGDELDIFANKRLAALLPMMTELVKLSEKWVETLASAETNIEQVKREGGFKGIGDYFARRSVLHVAGDWIAASAGGVWDAAKVVAGGAFEGAKNIVKDDTPEQEAARNKLYGNLGQWVKGELSDARNGTSNNSGFLSALLPLGKNSATDIVGGDKETQLLNALTGMGWSKADASGIVARMNLESGYNSGAYNPAGGGNGARGSLQWRGSRQDDYFRVTGKRAGFGTTADDLIFANWELTHTEAGAGAALRATDDPGQAGALVSSAYIRPGKTDAEKLHQAQLTSAEAERIYSAHYGAGAQVTINQTNTTTVNGATDPNATGSAVGAAQKNANASLHSATRQVLGAVDN